MTPVATKVLFLSQCFPPEMGAPAARVHECAREWVHQGLAVTVLTGMPHHPTGSFRRDIEAGSIAGSAWMGLTFAALTCTRRRTAAG